MKKYLIVLKCGKQYVVENNKSPTKLWGWANKYHDGRILSFYNIFMMKCVYAIKQIKNIVKCQIKYWRNL